MKYYYRKILRKLTRAFKLFSAIIPYSQLSLLYFHVTSHKLFINRYLFLDALS